VNKDVVPMRNKKSSLSLVLTLAFVCGLSAICRNGAIAQSDTQVSVKDSSTPKDAKAAACAHTLEQFVPALDAVMTENPRSSFGYDAVLAKYLFLQNGIPNLPAPAPGAAVDGCRIDEAVQIAKRSKYFHMTDGPPRYQHYVFEFRNTSAKVRFGIDKDTGNVIGPNFIWLAFDPD
jgi:hypothetical protein